MLLGIFRRISDAFSVVSAISTETKFVIAAAIKTLHENESVVSVASQNPDIALPLLAHFSPHKNHTRSGFVELLSIHYALTNPGALL
jgi:hypothetical protein